MAHLNNNHSGRRLHVVKVSRPNTSRLRLHIRVSRFFRILARMLQTLRKRADGGRKARFTGRRSDRKIIDFPKGGRQDCGSSGYYARSDFYHEEAVADCLEFIRRNSVSLAEVCR